MWIFETEAVVQFERVTIEKQNLENSVTGRRVPPPV
jgi:hypothetical protein